MKNELMMALKQKNSKLVNGDTTTRRSPDSNLVIYLTGVKVVQYRQVAGNRKEEEEEAKNYTAKKTATIKFHL